jgi:hypothetical protein
MPPCDPNLKRPKRLGDRLCPSVSRAGGLVQTPQANPISLEERLAGCRYRPVLESRFGDFALVDEDRGSEARPQPAPLQALIFAIYYN